MSKEQEITSLQHKNNLLETEVEKLETAIKDFKKAADEGQQHGTQNETLQRRLQLLEEEAENADKTLRESNEKYVLNTYLQAMHGSGCLPSVVLLRLTGRDIGSARLTSRPATLSARCRPSRTSVTSGSKSTRRWPRSTPASRRSWRSSRSRLATSNPYSQSGAKLRFLVHAFLVSLDLNRAYYVEFAFK